MAQKNTNLADKVETVVLVTVIIAGILTVLSAVCLIAGYILKFILLNPYIFLISLTIFVLGIIYLLIINERLFENSEFKHRRKF